MEKETLKNILDFLKQNENRNIPIAWKLINNEPLTEKELTIDHDLDLKGSTIKSLPEGLEVRGLLDLRNSEITSLPKGLEVGYELKLSSTKITSLPEGLKVDGILFIYNSPLKKYTDNELIEMVKPDGLFKRGIYRG
jgi:hypothetical protein